jgi:cytoskeleton protein RodZ
MNDPVAAEPEQMRAAESAQAAPAGFGYALAQARVRAGLSIEQLAARVRLHPKQLRALENEDLQLLPVPAYVNGFVRNCARELGLDSGPLIEDLNAKVKLRGLGPIAPDLGTGGPVPSQLLDDRGWRHLVLAAIVIALVCAGLIGVRMANSGSRDRAGQRTAGPAAHVPDSDAKGTSPAPRPGGAAAPAQGASPAAPGSGTGAPASPSDAPATTSRPDTSAVSPAPGAEAAARTAGAGSSHIPVATLAPAAGVTSGLVLRFNERSWVEVSQPDGRVLLSRSGEPGSMELVNSPAPLVLVIGRAEAVQVEYRGQTVNLKPYVNNNGVARVVLADGRVAGGGLSR